MADGHRDKVKESGPKPGAERSNRPPAGARIAAASALVVSVLTLVVLTVFTAGFGLFGYILVRLGCEPAPMILGFILGPLMEENLRRSLVLSRGDPMIFVQRPISAILLVLSACVVALIVLPALRKTREEAFQE